MRDPLNKEYRSPGTSRLLQATQVKQFKWYTLVWARITNSLAGMLCPHAEHVPLDPNNLQDEKKNHSSVADQGFF